MGERDELKDKVELGTQEGIKHVFDMLTYMAANTDDSRFSAMLQDLAEDVLEEASEYNRRWKDICELSSERDAAVRERDAAVEAMECADKMSDAIHAFCSDCDGECDNCQFCDVAISGDAYRHKRAALSGMEQKS